MENVVVGGEGDGGTVMKIIPFSDTISLLTEFPFHLFLLIHILSSHIIIIFSVLEETLIATLCLEMLTILY